MRSADGIATVFTQSPTKLLELLQPQAECPGGTAAEELSLVYQRPNAGRDTTAVRGSAGETF